MNLNFVLDDIYNKACNYHEERNQRKGIVQRVYSQDDKQNVFFKVFKYIIEKNHPGILTKTFPYLKMDLLKSDESIRASDSSISGRTVNG